MNRQLKALFIALMLTGAGTIEANAQNCKWVKEKTDPFTKEAVKTASMYIPDGWQITIERKGDQYSMGVVIAYSGIVRDQMEAGHKIMFKLSNDEVYELVLDKDVEPVFQAGVSTSWHIMVPVPKADFKKFKRNMITAIRSTIHGEDKTLQIGDRAGGKIQGTFECMMQD